MTTAAEIASGIEVTNKNSVTEKGDTACDIDIESKAAKENKFGTDPVFSPERKDKASNPLEIIVPLEVFDEINITKSTDNSCLLYTSPSPRDRQKSRMPSSA